MVTYYILCSFQIISACTRRFAYVRGYKAIYSAKLDYRKPIVRLCPFWRHKEN